MTEYKFKTKPYDHQMKAWEDSWAADYYALFMEMGTGKSKVAIDTIRALYKDKSINAALILAPKGVYDNWIKGEIPTHLPDDITHKIVRWSPSSAKKFQEEMRELVYQKFDGLKFFVMNVEALSTPRGTKAAYAFLKNNPQNIMIVDESTTIKTPSAARTKNILKIGKLAKYRRIMTGSPVTKNPLDVYSQLEFLSDQILRQHYWAFRSRYAIMRNVNFGPRSTQLVVGFQRIPELNTIVENHSYRVLKEDCLDLPDKVYEKRFKRNING